MNTDVGEFQPIVEPEQALRFQRISVGEVVQIKGEMVRVTKLEGRLITCQLMSNDDRAAIGNRHERRRIERLSR